MFSNNNSPDPPGSPWVPLGLPDSSFGEAARHIPTFQELVPQKSGGGETIEKCGKSSWINMVLIIPLIIILSY